MQYCFSNKCIFQLNVFILKGIKTKILIRKNIVVQATTGGGTGHWVPKLPYTFMYILIRSVSNKSCTGHCLIGKMYGKELLNNFLFGEKSYKFEVLQKKEQALHNTSQETKIANKQGHVAHRGHKDRTVSSS